jgi:hypothetical protein
MPIERFKIGKDRFRGVVAGRSCHAATWMRPRPAMIESGDRPPIIRITAHRPRGEELVERERPVEYVASDKSKFTLQIERAQALARHHARGKAGRPSARKSHRD